MSRKNIEDMFEVEGMEGFEGFEDYEEDEEDDDLMETELEKGDVIELTGEDGEDHPFAILDIIEYEHSIYMVLASADETDQDSDEAQDVVILEGTEDPEDPDALTFQTVEDDLTIRAIFAVFRERNREEYNFVDSE